MNLPNKLTLLRIILVPFFAAFLLLDGIPHHYLIALILFIVASITDMLDGKIARKHNMVTDFGKFADPLADKILVMAAFSCFVQQQIIGAAFLIIALFREFTVTSVRLVAAGSGKVVAANMWGKAKTVSQMIAIIAVLADLYLVELFSNGIITYPGGVLKDFVGAVNVVNTILLWITAVLTVISGVVYIKDNFEFIKNAK
ncbi:MAG: CDP-diacylglycerol--glycerol-3-phosphate 3-phosphatidyltransferase [Lachnospiraceae bacterium]|nr:CDP-diacylglycerol--glycerol-3-phosphate 3-phosphatidyltransferase [Lachnospiraceae bacterium]